MAIIDDHCTECDGNGHHTDDCPDITRIEAMRVVLNVMRHPLAMMSYPTRENAKRLALKFALSAHELLELAHKRASES